MILELLKQRCSVRNFSDQAIPPETIDYILECGRLSPSGGNEQPWKFGLVKDSASISKIADIAYGQKWIESSGFLVILCTVVVSDERGGRDIQIARFPEYTREIKNMDKDLYSKLNQEEHQTKIAGTHMVLAALEHGIGSTWISRFKVKELSSLLNLPAGCIPSEIIAFGYPENKMRPTKRKEMDDILFNVEANLR